MNTAIIIALTLRTIFHHPITGATPRPIMEGQSVATMLGDRVVLDLNQGFILAKKPSFLQFPILSAKDGGNQTLILIKTGQISLYHRRFTSLESWIKVVNFTRNSFVIAQGTIFTVKTSEAGTLTVGVEQSRVRAESSGVSVPLLSGQGAVLVDGVPPKTFKVDYRLDVFNLKKTRYLQRNIVMGCVLDGNIVSAPEGETVMVSVDGQNCFVAETPKNYVIVENINGNQRKHYFDGVRPFFEGKP